MDWTDAKSIALGFVKKYKYLFLVLLLGIVLMWMPQKAPVKEDLQTEESCEAPEVSLQDSLAAILSKIEGAGECEVLLTQAYGEETVYQTDEDSSSQDRHTDTVLINDGSRAETGLVRQINPPTYLGAVVVCPGADDPSVRLNIVEAVKCVTGLPSHQITVLKMK